MIRIEITDPESTDKKALRGIAEYLYNIAEGYDFSIVDRHPSFPLESIEQGLSSETIDRALSPETLKALECGNLELSPEWKEAKAIEEFGIPEESIHIPPAPPKVPEPVYAGAELDTRGFPWHERIHSRTKSKTKEGHWKYLRSVSPRLITEVENEIMGIVPVRAAPPPPPPIPAAVQQMDFIGLMEIVSEAIGEGKLFRADIHPILSRFGIASLPLAAEHPDKIPAIAAAINEVVKNAS